jgi:hypothetical protein
MPGAPGLSMLRVSKELIQSHAKQGLYGGANVHLLQEHEVSRLLDPEFKYVGSAATSIMDTWKRHGFKPTTKTERVARNAVRKPRVRGTILPFRRSANGK